jgi:Cu2+-exporting ATPase
MPDGGLVARPASVGTSCRHCAAPLPIGAVDGYCCGGCAGAAAIIGRLGLDRYYTWRARPGARPDPAAPTVDPSAAVTPLADGRLRLDLLVDGVVCAACVWLIERMLAADPTVVDARLSLTERRLILTWRGESRDGLGFVERLAALGHRAVPWSAAAEDAGAAAETREMLRAMAIAGFAAANIMLISAAIWSGHAGAMGPATRELLHWISAVIAVPAVAYAGRPFFRSAARALRAGRTNMDVPISIGVVTAVLVSLAETAASAPHAYFDSAVTLLFFLLVGRFLDRRARGRTRAVAARLAALAGGFAARLGEDGVAASVAVDRLKVGDRLWVAVGERVPVDGVVTAGTGETTPIAVASGGQVFAGMSNLSAPLTITATEVGDQTLLARVAELVAAAESARGRWVALADRVSRLYAPVVHATALATFLGWWLGVGLGWREAAMIAVAVLIITCPCALALAVPAVQVAVTGRLFRQGILVKSPTALERLATVDRVVLDKTGTLTIGRPTLIEEDGWRAEDLAIAAGLARASRHPLARALAAAAPTAPLRIDAIERPGEGVVAGADRLGSAAFTGAEAPAELATPALWLARPGRPSVRFRFHDATRADAAATLAALARMGLPVALLSGDRPAVVSDVARRLGIVDWTAAADPVAKRAHLDQAQAVGGRVLMVGDGLNDAPALAAAHASMAPASAIDLSRAAADVVFTGDRLGAVAEALAGAREAHRVARQNLAIALTYNLVAVPLAIGGLVTPLIAAAAMSGSSLLVVGNALRLARGGRTP